MRILIADDDRLFAEMLRTAISKQEICDVVGIAEDGEAAYELARTLRPVVVLMDASMPGMDGFEATRLIRTLPNPPTVVFISGAESNRAGDRAIHAGASAYFRKTEDLVSVIDFVAAWGEVHAHVASDVGSAQWPGWPRSPSSPPTSRD